MSYDRFNKGILGRNRYKKEAGNQPDMNGRLNIDGKTYYLAGWTRTGDDGEQFISLTVQSYEAAQAYKAKKQAAAPVAKPVIDPEFDDQVPF